MHQIRYDYSWTSYRHGYMVQNHFPRQTNKQCCQVYKIVFFLNTTYTIEYRRTKFCIQIHLHVRNRNIGYNTPNLLICGGYAGLWWVKKYGGYAPYSTYTLHYIIGNSLSRENFACILLCLKYMHQR
jgi:hypothetical protein